MDEYTLIEYQILNTDTNKLTRKRLIASEDELNRSKLNVYAMERVSGFWSKDDCKVEREVFDVLQISLSKIINKRLDVQTVEFLKCDLKERLTYLFQTNEDFIQLNASII